MTKLRPLVGLLLFAGLGGCEDLGTFALGVCGNKVLEIELGEDCDTFAGDNATCGAPGTAQACRFVCDFAAAASGCPEGWSCGRDGTCRARSRSFSDPTVLPLPSGELSVADFDGDERDDLVILGADGLSFAFADADGRFDNVELLAIEAPVASMLIAEVDGDDGGRDDLLYPTDDGIIVVPGNATRAPVPQAVPIELQIADDERVWFVSARALAPSDDVLVFGFYGSDTGFAIDTVGYEAQVTAPEVQAFLSNGPLAETGVGEVDVSDTPTDEELLLAVDGGAQVMVVTAHCFLEPFPGGCRLLPRATVTLPMGLFVSVNGARIADVDTDGVPDLVIDAIRRRGPMNQDERVVAWARGDGAGGFDAAQAHPLLTDAVVCSSCMGEEGRLLDAADIDEDGFTDYLSSRGILVRNSTTGFTFDTARSTTPWTTGRFVDLNRDGRLDTVATRPGALDIVIATPQERYNTFHAPVSGTVSRFAVGDFDGDLHLDVAVVEDKARLAVIFSGDSGVPRTRVLMAELPSTVALAGGRLPGPAADGIDDLLLAVDLPQSEEEAGEIGLVRFDGETSRRLTAELLLEVRAQVLAVGRFEDDAPAPQVLVGGRRAGTWTFTLFDGASLTVFGPVMSRALELEGVDPATGDWCGLTGEEGLVLTTSPGVDGRPDELFGAVARPVPQGTSVAPSVLRMAIRDGKISCQTSGAIGTTAARRIAVDDLDGDGSLDAIVGFDDAGLGLALDPEEDPLPLAIWWGSGETFADPTPYAALGSEEASALFVIGEGDGDNQDELVVVGENSVYLADVTRSDLVPTEIATLDRPGVRVGSLARLDVNGDGLEDVVLSTGEQVIAVLQIPCTAERVTRELCTREAPR